MSFNAICEYKILAKIFEFTVAYQPAWGKFVQLCSLARSFAAHIHKECKKVMLKPNFRFVAHKIPCTSLNKSVVHMQ